jgi:hypothetical protein
MFMILVEHLLSSLLIDMILKTKKKKGWRGENLIYQVIMINGPITKPFNVLVTSSAFDADAVTVISTCPNPIINPSSSVLSVFMAPGSSVVPH